MNLFDYIICFLLAVLLHVLGLLFVGWGKAPDGAANAVAPELDVTSVELTLEDSKTDSPASQRTEASARAPEVPALALPEPAEPAPVEALPDKPDFTAALTPPPTPVLQPQPQPSPVAVPAPAPAPAPAKPLVSSPRPATPAPPSAVAAPAAAAGQQATLQPENAGGGAHGRVDAHPSLERAIKPNYPIGSRRRGEEGTVILDVIVAADGRAANVSRVSSSGFHELDLAAERAAAQARFKPGTHDGKPIESAARLTLIFRLRDL